MTDIEETKIRALLADALPTAAIDTIVHSIGKLTQERRRALGKLIRGKATWEDWLGRLIEHPDPLKELRLYEYPEAFAAAQMPNGVSATTFRDLYMNNPLTPVDMLQPTRPATTNTKG